MLAAADGCPGASGGRLGPFPPLSATLFILYGFDALARREVVERAIGLISGYELQLWQILRDLHQLKSNDGQAAGPFLSNAGLI